MLQALPAIASKPHVLAVTVAFAGPRPFIEAEENDDCKTALHSVSTVRIGQYSMR
jgi:hypothetical protein